MTLVDRTKQPPPPPTAGPPAKFSLQPLGNPFAAPVNCESWEIRLPREVSATEYVAPFMAKLGRMLHVWIHVPTGHGSKNSVVIKANSNKNDRHTNQAIYDLECQHNRSVAYRIFTRWLEDMYRTGQAQDLIDFVQSEMKVFYQYHNAANQNAVNNCSRAIQRQTPVKPPMKSPKNSHFYTPKPNSAEEKMMQEEKEAEGAEPPKEPVTLGAFVKEAPHTQRAKKDARKSGVSHDDQHEKAKQEREESINRAFGIWERASHDKDLKRYETRIEAWRDRYRVLLDKLLAKEIDLRHFQSEFSRNFYLSYFTDRTLDKMYKDLLPLAKALLSGTYTYLRFDEEDIVRHLNSLDQGIEENAQECRSKRLVEKSDQDTKLAKVLRESKKESPTRESQKESPTKAESASSDSGLEFEEVLTKDKGGGRTLRVDRSVDKKNKNRFALLTESTTEEAGKKEDDAKVEQPTATEEAEKKKEGDAEVEQPAADAATKKDAKKKKKTGANAASNEKGGDDSETAVHT
ncbi:hypothetical protein PG988_011907 [Apiospora saccharicola]